LTDQISDVLYTTERSAHDNLAREGIAPERAVFVGNVMIDSLRASLPKAVPADVLLAHAGLDASRIAGGYGVVTLHRPSNVDHADVLGPIIDALRTVSQRLPLVIALHPRTRNNLEQFGMLGRLDTPDFLILPPQGYLEMLGLMSGARMVLTDSGGIQEETTALGVPCITIRENTERPITVDQGTNTLVGIDPQAIVAAARSVLDTGGKGGRIPELWDGRCATRPARPQRADVNGRGINGQITDAFTCDVEDYFQVSALAPHFPRDQWDAVPCRIERNVDRVLELLDGHGARGTFFTLGWI